MNASIVQRTLAIAAAIAVPWIGCSLWSARRERAEKEALAAEIRAEMEAHRRALVDEERGRADLTEAYRTAMAAAGDLKVPKAVQEQLMRTETWPTVPPEVAALFQTRGPALDAFAAAVMSLPPGRMTLTSKEWLRHSEIFSLLRSRGRVQVTNGELGGVLETVRLLRRISTNAHNSTHPEIPAWPANVAMGMEKWALDLLAQYAVHPALDEKQALEGLAIATGWREGEGERDLARLWPVEGLGRFCLDLLADDALQRLKQHSIVKDDSPLQRFEGLLQGKTPQRPTGPRGPPPTSVLRRMREIAARQKAAFERRDVAAVLLGSPLDLEAHEDLGEGWTAQFISPGLYVGRGRWELEVRIPVLRAAFAIRLHEIREGRTPASLEDLVPSLLESVPVDPWTGEKVRFGVRPTGWALDAGHPDTKITRPEGWTEIRVPYHLEK